MHNIYIDNKHGLWDGFTCDVTGMTLCELDSNDMPYSNYNMDGTPNVELNNAEAIQKMIADGEAVVESHVQAEVDKYNEANGTNFTDVDSCNKYVLQDTYAHQQFCIDIVAFNCLVWKTARQLQADGTVGMDTTEEEFIALLPEFDV